MSIISIPSIKNFFYINGLIWSISILEISTITLFKNSFFYFISIFFIFISRNYFLVLFIRYSLKNKKNIHENFTKVEDYKESYKHEFILNLCSSTIVETITYAIIKRWFFHDIFIIGWNDIIYFIPVSFIFEIIFDFFHYWGHRILHSHKLLYIYIHKKHHKFSYPMPILTFYHSPIDLIITNSIPQIITLCIFPQLTLFQFNLILSYKSFIEISGHSSKKLYPCGSFSQFIWLPRWLNISLYSEDHTLHHSNNNCNYAKRFSLWDKIFGTYMSTCVPRK